MRIDIYNLFFFLNIEIIISNYIRYILLKINKSKPIIFDTYICIIFHS